MNRNALLCPPQCGVCFWNLYCRLVLSDGGVSAIKLLEREGIPGCDVPTRPIVPWATRRSLGFRDERVPLLSQIDAFAATTDCGAVWLARADDEYYYPTLFKITPAKLKY